MTQENKYPRLKTPKQISTFRVIQSVFVGVTALGISLMLGDYATATHSMFTAISLTTTTFGVIGTGFMEVLSRKYE